MPARVRPRVQGVQPGVDRRPEPPRKTAPRHRCAGTGPRANPDPHSAVPKCLSGHLDDATACSPARSNAVNQSGIAAESVVTKAGGGQYADPTELFCTPIDARSSSATPWCTSTAGHITAIRPAAGHRRWGHWPTARSPAVDMLHSAGDVQHHKSAPRRRQQSPPQLSDPSTVGPIGDRGDQIGEHPRGMDPGPW